MVLHQCSQVIQTPSLGHDIEAWLRLQKQNQSLTENGMIIGEDYFHGMAK